MPRKSNYGFDLDDDYYDEYDGYGDHDYDHVEHQGQESYDTQSAPKPGTWCCSICTYENEETSSFCEICGVAHRLENNRCDKEENKKVNDLPKASGVSTIAQFLFASRANDMSKSTLIPQQPGGNLLKEMVHRPSWCENACGASHNFYKSLLVPSSKCQIDIVPFKFDSPSPDDLVYAAKSSSSRNLKDGKHPPSKGSPASTLKKPVADLKTNTKLTELATEFSERQDQSDASISCSDNMEKLKDPRSALSNLSLGNHILVGNSQKCQLPAREAGGVGYKPEKWMLQGQADDTQRQLNLAIVGHVDSGKSTLSGRLLHLLGRVSQKEMHKYEKESKQKGKGSFAYAWALDESAEERERGITMTVAVAYFDTRNYHVVLLDSPGHRDFVPNMISGATQADAAVLVVDASVGSFEAGMEGSGKGQTKEHAQLIRSFGVEQLIVAVNKMDNVKYSQERFNSIKSQLGAFLRSCGFKESSLVWIPLSAMDNKNLVAYPFDSILSTWYQGPHLLDAIDALQPPARDISKPLCMPICDIMKSTTGQSIVSGKIEAGAIKHGSKVLVMPSGDIATIRSMERDSHACSVARAGENVSICLQGIDISRVMTGGVLCHPEYPAVMATCLELKVLVLEVAVPILVGSQMEFHVHHAKEAARVTKLIALLDPKTGKTTKKAPRCLIAKQSAEIQVVLSRAVCAEVFSRCRALGRVFLRASGKTIAVGVVTRAT